MAGNILINESKVVNISAIYVSYMVLWVRLLGEIMFYHQSSFVLN